MPSQDEAHFSNCAKVKETGMQHFGFHVHFVGLLFAIRDKLMAILQMQDQLGLQGWTRLLCSIVW